MELKSIINEEFSGERISFLQLINDYFIDIPVIQRDYAQGRKDNNVSEIRNNFVENLITYIKDPAMESHDLDFIYGTVVKADHERLEFVPLDGQQRLTTLFLLHLYVAGRCGHFQDYETMIKGRFSYKTRNSSTMFCEKLVSSYKIPETTIENGKELTTLRETNVFAELKRMEELANNKVKESSKGKEEKHSLLSETIKNQGWFFKSWLQDPTVNGMLVMLDEIDRQFLNDPDDSLTMKAYSRIFEHKIDENPPVTFFMLPLNGYSRTDDLYIKMNARGIHLTDYENFKARIEDLMEDNKFDFRQEFKNKVDVAWSEYLWQYHGIEDNTDRIMENLLRNFIAYSYRTKDTSTLKEKMDYLLEQNRKTMRFTYSKYCQLGVFHKIRRNDDHEIGQDRIKAEEDTLRKTIDFFDIFCNASTTPENYSCDWFNPSSFIDKCCISKDATFSNRLRLYAYLQYHRTHTIIDQTDLQEWMRLVRNLDDATDIDDSEGFYHAICSIDDLLDKIGNKLVMDWLSRDTKSFSVKFFRNRQMKEECIKAQLREVESKFKMGTTINSVITKCDHDPYMTGQMGFLLDFAGCYDLYNNNSILTMTQDQVEECGKKLKEYSEKAILIFNKLSDDTDNKIIEDFLLERALLSIGMYLRGNTANRMNFCNQLKDPYNSWKTMLFMEDDTQLCRSCFHTLLDKINISQLETDLNNIISNISPNLPKWRLEIIQNKELIKYCTQGFIYIEDWTKMNDNEPDIILLSQSKLSHYHSELWTRILYIKNRNNYNIKYRPRKKFEEDTTVYFCFNYKDQSYTFEIYHWNKIWGYIIYDSDMNDVSSSMSSVTNNIVANMNGESLLETAYMNVSNNPDMTIVDLQ